MAGLRDVTIEDTAGVPVLEIIDLTAEDPRLGVPMPRPGQEPAHDAVSLVPLESHGPVARWQRHYVGGLVALDAMGLIVAGLIAMMVWFGTLDRPLKGTTYLQFLLVATVPWVLTLAASRAYDLRIVGLGSEEFRRVGNAVVRFAALLGLVAYAAKIEVARGMVGIALPVGTVIVLSQRYLARQALHRLRGRGRACHRVLLVGEGSAATALRDRLLASPHAGLHVVGRCAPVRHLGAGETLAHVREAIRVVGADTVAVAHSPGVTPEALRRMAWGLEGAGVDLLVAPALTDVAGPRIQVKPISGLPLLQIAAPQFTGGGRVVKRTIDILGSSLGLIVLAPLFAAVALLVVVTSRGPAFFTQQRIGRDGKPFTLVKFRSMCVDAEQRRAELLVDNDGDGVLFKLRRDPRVTRVGRWLRRLSIDELPQLVNVLRGQMSLVGPRPPLPSEVAQYEQHVHRRLLVTPGLTGLWQVNGRSALSWEESVRLDLYYVENWSVALDAEILWKTVFAVLRGRGAH